MTNEEVYAKVEKEKQRQKEIDNMWRELKCPVCGSSNFKSSGTYSMLNISEFMRIVKGYTSSDVEYKITPIECKECGYVVLKKAK